MRCNAAALVDDLDGVTGKSKLNLFLDEGVRHAVEVILDSHVIIEAAHRGETYLHVLIWVAGKLLQNRLFQLLEEASPTLRQLSETLVVQLFKQVLDHGVHLWQ